MKQTLITVSILAMTAATFTIGAHALPLAPDAIPESYTPTDSVVTVANRQRQATRISQIPRSVQIAMTPRIQQLAAANGGSGTAQLDDAEANLACGGDYLMVTWDEDKHGDPISGTTVLHCNDGGQIPVD